MVNRLFNPLIVRFAALAALLALVLAAPVAFAQDSSIPYPENGTDPVATFTASDQDDDPIEWDLSGPDAKLFTIDGGVLAFEKSPNYEKPNSAVVGGTRAEQNVYNVTLEATGGEHDVAVTVTNVDEDGEVSFNKPQPQAGRGLEATLEDEDGGVSDEEWRWARSEDGEAWADIEGATSQSRTPAAADVGSYLRATVTYTDLFDSGKSVSEVTANRVEARTVANAAPSFADQDDDTTTDGIQVGREVAENSAEGAAVGKPVSATDKDSDVLIYSLEDGNMVPDLRTQDDDEDMRHHDNSEPLDDSDDSKDGDSTQFTIDSATGQIKVKNDELDFETPADVDSDGDGNEDEASSTYLVTVIATDPSGAATSQLVTIKVTNANEAPAFTLKDDVPTVVRVRENETDLLSGASGDDALEDAYAADDEDADDVANTEADPQGIDHDNDDSTPTVTVVYGVEGTDKKYFTINTVEADGNDPGTLSVNHDPDDEDIAAGSDDAYEPNYEAKPSYSIVITITSGVDSRRLTMRLPVTVNVLDGEDVGKVLLSQREPQVGRTVIATVDDKDGGVTITDWSWMSAGLPTVAAGQTASCRALPEGHEDRVSDDTEFGPAEDDWAAVEDDPNSAAYTPTSDDAGKCLRATATYTDNIKNVDDTTTNNIDESEDTEISLATEKAVQPSDPANTAPLFPDQDPNMEGDQSDEASRTVAENTDEGESIGDPITAEDTTDLLMYSLSGPDADSFKIDNNGQLTTKDDLDYETKNVYTVVVNATDPSGASDSILVTVDITDEDDPAEIGGASARDYAENGTGPVATYTASDQDDDPIEWDLSGPDAKLFTIDGGVLAFVKSPNYEKPNSAVVGGTRAEQNVYNVTLEATGGEHDVAVTVTNVDEDGEVSFNKPQPQAGRGLEATLEDEDGGVSDEEWRWARSEDGEAWADIEGATSQSRTPAAADVGSYLRATVTYTDLFDSGKSVSEVTANRVEARTVANAAPSFADQDDDTTTDGIQVGREVAENSAEGAAVGKPVSATDKDSDVLIYSLEDGNMVPDLRTQDDTEDMRHHDNSEPLDDSDDSKDGDSTQFTIGSATGQIKVKNDELDFETPADVDSDGDGNEDEASNTYLVTVIATDPSGAAMSQLVTIKVTNANEAPAFDSDDVPTVVKVRENETDLLSGDDALGAAYAADDQDAVDKMDNDEPTQGIDHDNDDATDRVTVVYGVEGADKKYFTINTVTDSDNNGPGTLSVNHDPDDEGIDADSDDAYEPNYEAKSSYSIVITITSGVGSRRLTTRLPVTVNVLDGEDVGKVLLSQREPQVGRTVIATVDDKDGGVTITDWSWMSAGLPTVAAGQTASCRALPEGHEDRVSDDTEFGPAEDDWAAVEDDPNSAAYTPTSDDAGKCLRATATYTDNIKNVDDTTTNNIDESEDTEISLATEEPVQPSDPANTAPLFPDQDPNTEGDQSDEASRSVAENTDEGESIGAPITAEDTDLLMYSLSGPDADSFKIDNNGQLTTKADLDFESKATHTVVVTASDPSGAADSILVTIDVTDEDDAADITQVTDPVEPEEPENNAPAFDAASAARSVGENEAAGTNVGAPVTATDADNDDLAYSLSGSAYFAIDANSGQITTTMMLDHEDMASHEVTVTADDGNGGTGSITVTIEVGDIDLGGIADSYDANNDEMIDRDEASAAITDYLLHGTISQDEARAVVRAYLASP